MQKSVLCRVKGILYVKEQINGKYIFSNMLCIIKVIFYNSYNTHLINMEVLPP